MRGRRLAFVEVKRRLTAEAAEAAVAGRQAARIRSAADYWLASRPRYQDYEQGFRSHAADPPPLAAPHRERALGADALLAVLKRGWVPACAGMTGWVRRCSGLD
ncbi:MAG: YraN family protein [Hyphomicrobium sp.]